MTPFHVLIAFFLLIFALMGTVMARIVLGLENRIKKIEDVLKIKR